MAEGGKKVTKAPANIATTMISKDGETVPLFANSVILGAVENWLNELVKVMQDTLRQIMETALNTAANWELEKPREDWLFDQCAQITVLVSRIVYTEDINTCFEKRGVGYVYIVSGEAYFHFAIAILVVWSLILRFAVQEISEGDRTAKEGLLLWAQKKVEEVSKGKVQVTNFHNSWADGMAF